jgi:DNA mismatch repair protein MSH5
VTTDKEFSPGFRLKPGFCTHSYGLYCARIAGLPEDLVKRSEEVGEATLRGESIQPVSGTIARTEKQTQSLIEEFTKFDPKKGDLKAFMEFLKQEKWRV